MKTLVFIAFLFALLAVGCGHGRYSPSSLSSAEGSFLARFIAIPSDPALFTLVSAQDAATVSEASESSHPAYELLAESRTEAGDRGGNQAEEQEARDEEAAMIADPLEPFNRAMHLFNDKLYFWALKPVSQGYNKVVPEKARVSVKNFFSNLGFPVRFVSCLFQADFSGAAAELGRFTVNTVWGVGGLLDPSSSQQLNLPKRDADIGQTLGFYGLGQGFYIVWPVLGPSSARDSAGIVGDFFLYPVSYIRPWYDWLAVRAYQEVNDTSLRIGDYESLKDMAIDPYVALRDAYSQYRQKKVEAIRGKGAPPKPAGVR